MGKKIVLCNCGGERISQERLQAIEQELVNSNLDIIKISDLCRISALQRERLCEVFKDDEEYQMIGCYSRTMKLLLDQAEPAINTDHIEFVNFLESTDEEIFAAAAYVAAPAPATPPVTSSEIASGSASASFKGAESSSIGASASAPSSAPAASSEPTSAINSALNSGLISPSALAASSAASSELTSASASEIPSSPESPVQPVMKTGSVQEVATPSDWPSWYPVIDYARCTACGQCADFCLFGVYEKSPDKVTVTNPQGCKYNCPACGRICPQMAIIFPKYKPGGAIGGSEFIDEISEQKRQTDDINSILGGDIYQALERRKLKRRSIILDEAMNKALTERMNALSERKK